MLFLLFRHFRFLPLWSLKFEPILPLSHSVLVYSSTKDTCQLPIWYGLWNWHNLWASRAQGLVLVEIMLPIAVWIKTQGDVCGRLCAYVCIQLLRFECSSHQQQLRHLGQRKQLPLQIHRRLPVCSLLLALGPIAWPCWQQRHLHLASWLDDQPLGLLWPLPQELESPLFCPLPYQPWLSTFPILYLFRPLIAIFWVLSIIKVNHLLLLLLSLLWTFPHCPLEP